MQQLPFIGIAIRNRAGLALHLFASLVGIGCTFPDLDLAGKACPCSAEWTCDTETNRCVPAAPPLAADPTLVVESGAARPRNLDAGARANDAAWADPVPERDADPSIVLDAGPEDAGGADADLDSPDGGADGTEDATPPATSPDDASTPDAPPDDATTPDASPGDASLSDASPGDCESTMLGGDRLHAGKYLCSPNGRYRFGLDPAGDLQFLVDGLVVWSAGTCCGSARLAMQRDGNLVVYDQREDPVFATDTARYAGAWLSVEDDARAVLRYDDRVIWSTARD